MVLPLISAVVVTYQPDAKLLDHLHRLSSRVAEIILVDNGSGGSSLQFVESAARLPGVELRRNGSNLGIATALNMGIRRALSFGRPWIATFDQDSAISENYFEGLFQAYETCPASRNVGMIVPGGWGEPRARAGKPQPARGAWSFVRGAVNSGSLIKAEVFSTAGSFDDALFIDYVDTDFCLRLQKCGFKILSAAGVFLEHELGEKQTCRGPGFQISFRVHTAWRYYYIVRNRLVLYRRHLAVSPLWVLRDAAWLVLELGRILCLEKGRKSKLPAAFRGLCDGLRGRTGRHPSFPPGGA
ncbi:MAG: glycosyltransferase family 2 protein [Verrucomicrobiota bacterium]|nr:glycosyltransferase family 2 protein [Verrucomicrobiota bacterium]